MATLPVDIMQYLSGLTKDISPEGVLAGIFGASEQPQADPNSFSVGPGETFQNDAGSFSKTHMRSPSVENPEDFQLRMINSRLVGGEGDREKNLQLAALLQNQIQERDKNAALGGRSTNKLAEDGLSGLIEERDKADAWLKIAGMGQDAINQAGETGPINNTLGYLGSFLPLVGADQSKKLAGNTAMDRLGAQGIKLLKTAGSGPLSDADMARLMSALPTSDKLKSQNQETVDQAKSEYGKGKQVLDLAIKLVQAGKASPVDARGMAEKMLGGQQPSGQMQQQGQSMALGDDEARIQARMAQLGATK